jgi:hypothetical protein
VANVEGTNVGKDNNEYVIARVRNFEAWARGGGAHQSFIWWSLSGVEG